MENVAFLFMIWRKSFEMIEADVLSTYLLSVLNGFIHYISARMNDIFGE